MFLNKTQKDTLQSFLIKLRKGEYTVEPHPCLCGAQNSVLIAQKERYGIPLRTVLCLSCGLLRSDPYYTEKSLAGFYAHEYRALYSGKKTCDEEFFTGEYRFGTTIYDFLVQHHFKDGIKGRKIYEVGCGAGGILEAFREQGNEVFGCDFDKDFIQFGKGKGLSGLEIGGAETLKKHGPADFLILNHVVEHLPNPLSDLMELKALVKDGGTVYIALPGIYRITRLSSFLQNAHTYHFTLKTLTTLLHRTGFRLVYGTEEIRAIFTKGIGPQPEPDDPQDVYRYLNWIKRWSFVYRLRTLKPREVVKQRALQLLRKNQKVYARVRSLYRILKGGTKS